MENRELAIQITGLKKIYKLGQIGGGSLQRDIQSWWARVRGKEDPNTKIGAGQRSNGKTFMALNGVDLTVYKGEALGIIGHNGAGKSTLLKLLSRVTAPTEGEIGINGRIASMLEVGTGFNGEMTGRENVYMNGTILGMTKAEIDAKMDQIIEFSEIGEFIDTPVKRYSSGMYVKLAFSVAAHLDSEIMIMDEVLAVGDMAFQKKCLDKMREVANQEGRTVLYVSHNMNTIRQLCDRCVVLDKGKVAFVGDVEEAVGVYMGATDSLPVHYDYAHFRRKANFSISGFMLSSLDIENVERPSYQTGDAVRLRLTFQSNMDIEKIRFRFELYHNDGSVIGTMLSEPLLNSRKGETGEIGLTMDTTDIMPGRYAITMVAFSMNEDGSELYMDGVSRAFEIEIYDMRDIVQPLWNHQYWGHVRLNDITKRDI